MKVIFLMTIRLYWLLVPRHKRRRCLFKESCSKHIYSKTKSEGFVAGIRSLKFRISNCNPNYDIIDIDGEKILLSSSMNVFKTSEINGSILYLS
jgi:uncharacterized protein